MTRDEAEDKLREYHDLVDLIETVEFDVVKRPLVQRAIELNEVFAALASEFPRIVWDDELRERFRKAAHRGFYTDRVKYAEL